MKKYITPSVDVINLDAEAQMMTTMSMSNTEVDGGIFQTDKKKGSGMPWADYMDDEE